MNYESIKNLARERGVPVRELLALTEDNDPFYVGRPGAVADAEWFAGLWKRYNFPQGVHLRRIHYTLVNDPVPVVLRNGETYLNTEHCWDRMGIASKSARYLQLVDAGAFVDRRTPEPVLFAESREYPASAGWEVPSPNWYLPEITADFETYINMPSVKISGFDYSIADQRYHLIVQIEKSTMNDILIPLCSRYGIDLIVGVGFSSVTSTISMLRRAKGRPIRLFFISDFDPAGDSMPVAMARQVEFWRPLYAKGVDIKIQHLGLTKEQVIHYQLPRIPLKESDARRRDFEDRRGEGGVELDALEAIFPGQLEQIVNDAIAPYFDSDLHLRLAKAREEAYLEANEVWHSEVAEIQDEISAISAEADEIVERFKEPADELADEFARAMEPMTERLDLARQAMAEKIQELEIVLPERPAAREADADESRWLFDSSRDYFEQLESYKRHKKGE